MERQFGASVKRVIALNTDGSGSFVPKTIYQKKRKRRKQSRELREVERLVRKLGQTNQAVADAYMFRHKNSNQKRRDGWLRDLGKNVYKSSRKGTRKLRRTF